MGGQGKGWTLRGLQSDWVKQNARWLLDGGSCWLAVGRLSFSWDFASGAHLGDEEGITFRVHLGSAGQDGVVCSTLGAGIASGAAMLKTVAS